MWITAENAIINVDHVARFVLIKGVHGGFRYRIEGPNGETLGTVEYKGLDTLKRKLNSDGLVPAQAGQTGFLLSVIDDDTGPPIVEVIERTIVAWRVSEDDAEPVFANAGDDPGLILLKRQDGRYDAPWIGEFNSIEDAKAMILPSYEKKA